jgi:hypothetical protein
MALEFGTTPATAPTGTPLYATVGDFVARYGQALAVELSQLAAGVTTRDDARITLALLDADKRITLGLARRYVAPVAVADLSDDARRELRDLSTLSAYAWLQRSRPGRELDADGRPVDLSKDAEADFRRRVALLAAGIVPLPGATLLQRRPTMEVRR